jgi:suppressor for copper-sensitivity B
VRFVSGLAAAPGPGFDVPLDLGIEFALAPGWHVYWKNSGDAGYAPKLDLAATPEISGATLLFPSPHRFDLPGGLVSFGYENEVIYPVSGSVRTAGGPLTIRGRLDYLTCAAECVPHTADLELVLPAEAGEPGDDEAARLALWRSRLPRPAGGAGSPAVALELERDAEGSTLVLTAAGGGFRASAPELFFDSHERFGLGRPALSIGDSGVRFRVPIHPLDETKPWPDSTEFSWTLTGLEGAEGAFAVEGVSRVDIPSPVAPLRRFWWLAPVVALPLLALAFQRSRRARGRSTDRSDGARPQPAS